MRADDDEKHFSYTGGGLTFISIAFFFKKVAPQQLTPHKVMVFVLIYTPAPVSNKLKMALILWSFLFMLFLKKKILIVLCIFFGKKRCKLFHTNIRTIGTVRQVQCH